MNRVASEYNDFCIFVGEPEVEENVWIGYFTVIDGSGGLKIGRGTDIASGVHIYTHDTVKRCLEESVEIERSPVTIGRNVFIGANSVILRGTTIGDHSVIGAGSVVDKDVPSYSLAVGNPVRIIRGKYET